jgi:hypothetical protein
VLLYGCENCVTTWDKNKIQAAEIKFLQKVKGCTRLDKPQNEDIRRELKFSLNNRILEYRHDWFQCVQ